MPTEISQKIRNLVRTWNPLNLACSPPKQICCTDKYYKRILWTVREATGAGNNDAIYLYNYERDSWTRWTGAAVTAMARYQGAGDYEYVVAGDASGHLFYIAPPNVSPHNYDKFTSTGTEVAIDGYMTSPWINIPKALGIHGWQNVRTELQKFVIYAGGEPVAGTTASVTLTTNFWTDFGTTIMGTFTTTHSSSTWPTVTVEPKTIALVDPTNPQGTVNWIKLKIRNADKCHFKIFKVVFLFKLKRMVDK